MPGFYVFTSIYARLSTSNLHFGQLNQPDQKVNLWMEPTHKVSPITALGHLKSKGMWVEHLRRVCTICLPYSLYPSEIMSLFPTCSQSEHTNPFNYIEAKEEESY